MILKLPKRIKELIRWIIQKQVNIKYFTVFAFFTGALISIFEFVCTGQVYLPTIIYIMGVPEYRGQAFGYLVLYNLMFIIPLILIFMAAYFGVSDNRLKEFLKKHVGLIKILTAVMFFVLGVGMVWLSLEVIMYWGKKLKSISFTIGIRAAGGKSIYDSLTMSPIIGVQSKSNLTEYFNSGILGIKNMFHLWY